MKKVVAAIGIMVFLFGAAAGVFAAEDVVKIGYLRIIMSFPTFVAQEKDFFVEQGLQVELIPFNSGTAIIDALVAGRIDANCGSAMTGHWFAAQTAPDRFKIFLVYGTTSRKEDNSFVVMVKKDSPLKDLKDLKGKKVGTYPGATSVALARAVIRTQIDPEEVVFTEVPPPNLIPALAAGQIDAFFAPEPSGMLAVSQGMGQYLIKSPLTLLKLKGGFPGMAFSFSAKFLQDRPEQAKKVKAAIDKAVSYIRGHEQEARPYLVEYTGLPEPVAMNIPFDRFITLEEFDKKAGQALFDLLYKEGAYKNKIDTTQLYYEN
jgi:ABC-type nitrate/sulfonate/bicarbonate transport system substrate-binding protein